MPEPPVLRLSIQIFLPTDTDDAQLFLFTDRPIFKPGDSFAFKGVLREQKEGKATIPTLTSANTTVEVRRADGTASRDDCTVGAYYIWNVQRRV